MTNAATKATETKFSVGDRVEGGRGEDHDHGRIVEIGDDGDSCVVAWDSCARTPCNLSALFPEGDMPAQVSADAIARSISHNEIVTIDYSEADYEDLLVECDDRADNNDVHEFWGTRDEDGKEWRVHMRKADSENS